MKNKTTRFLTASLILVSAFCIAVFSFLALYMTRRNEKAITEVGTIYMAGISEQISMHFQTAMGLRLSQLEALTATIPPKSDVDTSATRKTLAYNAEVRGFDHLAFCSSDGTLDMIYGDPIQLEFPELFLNSLNQDENKISVGTDASGNRIVLIGIPTSYPMADGNECTGLIAGLPIEYISNTLSLEREGALMYSHIIRNDGTFVIRSSDASRDTYFQRIRDLFQELNGTNPEQYVENMKAAMDAHEDYSSVILIGDERRHLYCTPLSYSEWYLVTVMPYGTLDETINQLGHQWICLAIGSCILIQLVLLAIFARYFRLTRQQIQDLDAARREAILATKAKSEFLSNMSHDIRTPMNAIVGMTAIATANIDNPQQVQNCLKKITLSSKHLLGLINDILDMSKIESGKMTLNSDQVSLREVMDSIVSIVQPQIKAKNQKFNVFIHDITTEEVCCDSVRLNQILLNLLSNAIKFTPAGGSIQIALYEEPSPKGDSYIQIHIEVTDSGIGMSPEFAKRIFESFAREDNTRVHKVEGTGLGMTITKHIVDAMGGTIQVQSEQGKGSRFHVVLDLERSSLQEADMILPDWNMLVVDDDIQLCESTVSSLQSIGVSAEWALSGEDAVKLVDRHHSKHTDYQIILLDWKLPGMDGIQTAREIRKHLGKDVPILLISAYDWSEIEDAARDAGVSGFLSKPLFKSTLFYGLRPFAEASAHSEEPAENASDHYLNGKRILLAEDNDLNWEIAQELLSDLGLELEHAENGKICVDKFTQAPAGYYDAIIMDIRMPVMNGYDASIAIRQLNRPDADLPIIAMTADAFSEDIKRCLDCGMNAHVAKPIDIREVSRILKKYI